VDKIELNLLVFKIKKIVTQVLKKIISRNEFRYLDLQNTKHSFFVYIIFV